MVTRETASPELLQKLEALLALKNKAWGCVTSKHIYQFQETNRQYDELARHLASNASAPRVPETYMLESLSYMIQRLLEFWLSYLAVRHSTPQNQSLSFVNFVKVLSCVPIKARDDLKYGQWRRQIYYGGEPFFGFDYQIFFSKLLAAGFTQSIGLKLNLFKLLLKETKTDHPYLFFVSTGERITFSDFCQKSQYRKCCLNFFTFIDSLKEEVQQREITAENHNELRLIALSETGANIASFIKDRLLFGYGQDSSRLAVDWHELYLRAKNEYTLHRDEIQLNICLWYIICNYYGRLKSKELRAQTATQLVDQAIVEEKEYLNASKKRLNRMRELNVPRQIVEHGTETLAKRQYLWLALRQCKPLLIEQLIEIAPEL